jgi:DNA polymerase/3'-5' exonuclease PolX
MKCNILELAWDRKETVNRRRRVDTMENPEVAQVFDEVADLLELLGENPFRTRAYRRAAVTVRDLAQPLAKLIAEHPERLIDLSGIGAERVRCLKSDTC